METIITRDTDVIREYLAALDARERGLSPFARLAAIVKLSRLKQELGEAQIDTTDDDLLALRREVDERLNRTFLRRFAASRWGARLLLFLMIVGFQQVLFLICWLATLLFARFAPRPGWWNPLLPYEEPFLLYGFVFLFFFATPMLAVAAFFSGRVFRAWRTASLVTLLLILLSSFFTFWVLRREVKAQNPTASSLSLLARKDSRGEKKDGEGEKKDSNVEVQGYRQWVKENWLLSDVKFQRDYEKYLRNGPGRWVTSRVGEADASWREALPLFSEYVDSGQDKEGFREWVEYYLDRNRIYSEDHVKKEAETLTSEANQRFLGIWQVEPFLKERDERVYRAYLGDVNRALYKWGLVSLADCALAFLLYYLIGPVLSMLSGKPRRPQRVQEAELVTEDAGASEVRQRGGLDNLRERYFSFPERQEINSTPFFEAPFDLMANAHRAFIRLVVFTSILVFAFWALIYALTLHEGRLNAPSQADLMRSHLLFGGAADDRPAAASTPVKPIPPTTKPDVEVVPQLPPSEPGPSGPGPSGPEKTEPDGDESTSRLDDPLNLRLLNLSALVDENDYATGKMFKEQMRTIQIQKSEIASLKSFTEQLQQTTSNFPTQVSEVNSRASAAEARAGQVIGEVNATRQQTATVEEQLMTKLKDVEGRAARAAEQVGKIEDQSSVLATRTEALEKELDRRARQIEARTEELGERTASLNEREERFNRLQRITFTVIVANLRSEIEDFDRRIDTGYYRTLPKTAAQSNAASLRDRIALMAKELRDINTDLTKPFVTQLEELGRRLEQVAAKVR